MRYVLSVLLLLSATTVYPQSATIAELRVGQMITVSNIEPDTIVAQWLPATCVTITPLTVNSAEVRATQAGTCSVNALLRKGGYLLAGHFPVLVRVRDQAIATALIINPYPQSLAHGETFQFSASVVDQYGVTMYVPSPLNWQSSSVSVSVTASGLATGMVSGTAFISVTDGSFNASTQPITVPLLGEDTFDRPDGFLEGSSDGGTWTKVSAASGNVSVFNNRLRSGSTNVNIYRHSTIPFSANYSVEAMIYANNISGTTRIGPAVRVDQFGNGYSAYYVKANNKFEIALHSGGSLGVQPVTTVIATTANNSHIATAGQNYVTELIVNGNQLSLKVDSVLVIVPFTNSVISAAGQPGLRASVNSTNFLLDNWKVKQ